MIHDWKLNLNFHSLSAKSQRRSWGKSHEQISKPSFVIINGVLFQRIYIISSLQVEKIPFFTIQASVDVVESFLGQVVVNLLRFHLVYRISKGKHVSGLIQMNLEEEEYALLKYMTRVFFDVIKTYT